jgi:adenylate cyclase
MMTLLTTVFLQSLDFFSRIESATFDHRVGLFRADQVIHENVVVILIDEKSLQSMDDELGRWPWPRSAYVDLLDYFALAGAQAFAFDILFTEQQDTDKDNYDDQSLVEATRRAGNTLHAMQLLHSPLASRPKSLPEDFQLKYALESSNFVGPEYNDYLLPIEALYKASRDIGFLEIEPDRDGVYRRVRLFNQFPGGQIFPSIASALTLPLLTDSKSIFYDKNHAEIGSLQVPLDGNGNYLINPYGRVNSYSAVQVIRAMQQIRAGGESPALDPKLFEGKLVLLGASAIGLLDVKATALASKEAGVFLHAYTVSNILNQDFLIQLPQALFLAMLLIVCCICVIPAITISRHLISFLFPVSTAIIYLIVAYAGFTSNQVFPVTPIMFAILMSALLAYSLRNYHEKNSKQKIIKMLGQCVSPNVLTTVIDNHEDLPSETGSTESLSILFAHVYGFTNISESLEASKLVDLLNTYFSDMTKVIIDHNGTLDKFIGDTIMAFWGAPLKTLDHPRLALESAIAMHERLQHTNEILRGKNYPNIEVGIGIHSGEVVLGNIGSEMKLAYTVIGESVNLASSLVDLTRTYNCPLIISEDTWSAVCTSVPCILVDRVKAKGKLAPVGIYAPTELFLEKNKLPISTLDLQEISERAFNLYLQRDWQSAAETYGQIGECVLSDLFQGRCRQYHANEPGPEWDGVFIHSAS